MKNSEIMLAAKPGTLFRFEGYKEDEYIRREEGGYSFVGGDIDDPTVFPERVLPFVFDPAWNGPVEVVA